MKKKNWIRILVCLLIFAMVTPMNVFAGQSSKIKIHSPARGAKVDAGQVRFNFRFDESGGWWKYYVKNLKTNEYVNKNKMDKYYTKGDDESFEMDLDPGSYKVKVKQYNDNDKYIGYRYHTFTVEGEPTPSSDPEIVKPKNKSTVDAGKVTFQLDGNTGYCKYYVYNSKTKKYVNEDKISSKYSKETGSGFTLVLPEGSYKFYAKFYSDDGDYLTKDTHYFEVEGNPDPITVDDPEIVKPKDNSTVDAGKVTFQLQDNSGYCKYYVYNTKTKKYVNEDKYTSKYSKETGSGFTLVLSEGSYKFYAKFYTDGGDYIGKDTHYFEVEGDPEPIPVDNPVIVKPKNKSTVDAGKVTFQLDGNSGYCKYYVYDTKNKEYVNEDKYSSKYSKETGSGFTLSLSEGSYKFYAKFYTDDGDYLTKDTHYFEVEGDPELPLPSKADTPQILFLYVDHDNKVSSRTIDKYDHINTFVILPTVDPKKFEVSYFWDGNYYGYLDFIKYAGDAVDAIRNSQNGRKADIYIATPPTVISESTQEPVPDENINAYLLDLRNAFSSSEWKQVKGLYCMDEDYYGPDGRAYFLQVRKAMDKNRDFKSKDFIWCPFYSIEKNDSKISILLDKNPDLFDLILIQPGYYFGKATSSSLEYVKDWVKDGKVSGVDAGRTELGVQLEIDPAIFRDSSRMKKYLKYEDTFGSLRGKYPLSYYADAEYSVEDTRIQKYIENFFTH